MNKYSFASTFLLLVSATSAGAAPDPESEAYKSGVLIGYVILGGLVLLVVIDLLRRKGMLGTPKAEQSEKKRWKMSPFFLTCTSLFLLVVVYVASYIPRRSDGAYQITKSGATRTEKGIPLPDIQLWNPSGCQWQHTFQEADGTYRSKGNKWGFFYAPLISLDRRLNYPDIKIDRPPYVPSPSDEMAKR